MVQIADRFGRPLWVGPEHIGWAVETAGIVNLDLEDREAFVNDGPRRVLPRGERMQLRGIEGNYAYTYNDNGVMRMPLELLKPWNK